MKNTANIEKLLTLYFEGRTNATEENILKEFFSQKSVPEAFRKNQLLMLALFQKDGILIPTELEQKINSTIDSLALEEKRKAPYPFKRWKWMTVVAALIIAISLPLYINKGTEIKQFAQLSQTDKEKIEEAQKALLLLSKNYNKGLQQLTMSQETLSENKRALNHFITITNSKNHEK